MSIMQGLRAYHAALGLLVIAAFLTGELGTIHAVLGYAIAVIIAGRLIAALSGLRQLGLSRFYPQFDGLTLGNAFTHPAISKTLLSGIAACLILATASGIAMDRGRTLGTLGLAASVVVTEAHARDEGRERRGGAELRIGDQEHGIAGELHEGLSNVLMIIVGLHVAYLFLFKRPLARFMLFLAAPKPREASPRRAP
ncbi:cytochrome b/b6 domain-containing protein [Roseomonas rosulenta]|uniref:cytochrome b/b6 domain-containing protein n=1 Tax=Roseomonas rosulenta TaxID=2748667 RepID=UPI0018E04769|nr:cytochrome b/b6 domain-containing protein [Roseomonas rosulenta]